MPYFFEAWLPNHANQTRYPTNVSESTAIINKAEQHSLNLLTQRQQRSNTLFSTLLTGPYQINNIMLDIADFIVEKGGNPQKIKESQKRRYASEEVVDQVIALYEDHRKSRPETVILYAKRLD